MQLNEILEENDINKISLKTNISKENIEILSDEDFSSLTKAKTLGFISILERDYQVDLNILREKALTYFDKYGNEQERMIFTLPESGENIGSSTGGSKWILLIVLGLLAYGAWYFISKYDDKILNTWLPFIGEKSELNSDSLTTKGATENMLDTTNISIETLPEDTDVQEVIILDDDK